MLYTVTQSIYLRNPFIQNEPRLYCLFRTMTSLYTLLLSTIQDILFMSFELI